MFVFVPMQLFDRFQPRTRFYMNRKFPLCFCNLLLIRQQRQPLISALMNRRYHFVFDYCKKYLVLEAEANAHCRNSSIETMCIQRHLSFPASNHETMIHAAFYCNSSAFSNHICLSSRKRIVSWYAILMYLH